MTRSDTFSVFSAGAQLLGRDIAKIASQETLESIKAVLTQQIDLQERSLLLRQMSNVLGADSSSDCLNLIESILSGLQKSGAIIS